jgi:hypothetical protein
MNAFKKAVFAATFAMAGFSTGAHATLIGDKITLTYGSYTETDTIGNGIEFSGIANYLDFDFSATQLTVMISKILPHKYTFPTTLSSVVFSKFDDLTTGFTLISNSPQFKDFGPSDYSFNAGSLTLNFAGVEPANENAELVFGIVASPAIPPASNDVPEPATVALLGLGLLSIAASRRKFSKK